MITFLFIYRILKVWWGCFCFWHILCKERKIWNCVKQIIFGSIVKWFLGFAFVKDIGSVSKRFHFEFRKWNKFFPIYFHLPTFYLLLPSSFKIVQHAKTHLPFTSSVTLKNYYWLKSNMLKVFKTFIKKDCYSFRI